VPDLPPLPQLVAAGLGHDYAALRASLKHDQSAQDAWEQIDRTCREAIGRFVAQRDPAEADAYLAANATIAPGTLAPLWDFLADLLARMLANQELAGVLRALRGGYVSASPGSDIVRNPAVVPTGRNIYGLDPFNMPSAVAQQEGQQIAADMLARLSAEQGSMPETVAMVLWGIDNLKSGGEGIAQVLALLGARVVLDELGKAAGVELIPLADLGRPRIDVVVTVSGIFRDLLHHQMVLIDKAVHLAAHADEPPEQNFVRAHALAQAAELGVSLDEAATRVFANAPGSYGANLNHLVDSGTWEDETQISDAFLSRKSFSFRADSSHGEWRDSRTIMERALSTVDATFQNIDSFEVGISDIDYYYESLGGVTKSVEVLRGKRPPVLVADAVSSSERLSSLEQMVRLETRAKLLNPRWFEAMLEHGSEGVREIEARVGSTYGWSVTAQAVDGWAYQGIADTFLLDEAMRARLAQLNPHAVTSMTQRLLEANARGFWDADDATIAALHAVYDDLEDRIEGIDMSNVVG
jgi:magnesium chelatase subunit H